MTKIYFKNGLNATISSDLLEAVRDMKEILREKLGDDTEKVFTEIVSDVFDYGITKSRENMGVDSWEIVNPFV